MPPTFLRGSRFALSKFLCASSRISCSDVNFLFLQGCNSYTFKSLQTLSLISVLVHWFKDWLSFSLSLVAPSQSTCVLILLNCVGSQISISLISNFVSRFDQYQPFLTLKYFKFKAPVLMLTMSQSHSSLRMFEMYRILFSSMMLFIPMVWQNFGLDG